MVDDELLGFPQNRNGNVKVGHLGYKADYGYAIGGAGPFFVPLATSSTDFPYSVALPEECSLDGAYVAGVHAVVAKKDSCTWDGEHWIDCEKTETAWGGACDEHGVPNRDDRFGRNWATYFTVPFPVAPN
jgi:hypothetical protein